MKSGIMREKFIEIHLRTSPFRALPWHENKVGKFATSRIVLTKIDDPRTPDCGAPPIEPALNKPSFHDLPEQNRNSIPT
ncbi:MAG: hypothetical protein EAZ84_07555 [Verrucomicrobia bacterium]|nr:MAG: hypothetical protein EAZ84_07555 [Verrucomicrobiota bacterium]TAE88688.1 MAG: hypothetical protein EAZ82_03015 [Verrucomicrobiota bacterium]TAF26489.1 MAG: hypothetical protein EAZ71_04540 [Verrucomicrobiota bacterium]